MNSSNDWAKIIGGSKSALMWFSDFIGFLSWRQLEFDCLKNCLRKLEESDVRIINSDDLNLRLSRELSVIGRLFPELDKSLEPKLKLQSKLDELRLEFKDPILAFLKRDDSITSELSDERRGMFERSFREFLGSLDYSPKDLRVLDKRGVLNHPRLVRNSSYLWCKIAPEINSAQARYFVAMGLRLRCKAELDADTARSIQVTCNALNEVIEEKRRRSLETGVKHFPGAVLEPIQLVNCHGESFANPYRLPHNPMGRPQTGLVFSYLMQIGDLRRQEPIRPSRIESDSVGQNLRSSDDVKAYGYKTSSLSLDAEFILSKLFGFPLAQTGIDDLFGGGGIFYYDSTVNCIKQKDSSTLPGRIVLVRGGFGSGKTSFGLTTAAAIAQCGGLAVYFALEFDRQQTLFNLERLGYPTEGGRFKTFCSLRKCMQHFRKRIQNKFDPEGQMGAILILEVQPSSNAINVEKLFDLISGIAESDWPVFPRMVVVDSLNAVRREFFSEESNDSDLSKQQPSESGESVLNRSSTLRSPRKNDPEFRRVVLRELRKSTGLGTNIALLSEEDDPTWVSFGEDISDTVIRLYGPTEDRSSVDHQFPGMPHRSISISKSRYQKEHSGFHSFEIEPGRGFRIRLSTEARAAIFRSRGEFHLPSKRFGVTAIDKLLSSDHEAGDGTDESANCGRVVCMEGALGTFKTQFGICFLQASYHEDLDLPLGFHERAVTGLVISMRYDDGDIRGKIKDEFCDAVSKSEKQYNIRNTSVKIDTCHLPTGNVSPDHILLSVKEHLDIAIAEDRPVTRVLLDNPGEWEDLCPILAADQLWAGTLIEFLRTYGVRILVTNRQIAAKDSRLIRAILEQVDTSIVLGRKEIVGENANTIQVNRSPNMKHISRAHRIDFSKPSGEVSFEPLDSLSYDADGRVLTTKVRILRRRQSRRSEQYWEHLKSLIRTAFSSKVRLETTGSFGHRFEFGLANGSVFDSLNLVEIDEFELSEASDSLADLKLTCDDRKAYDSRFSKKLSRISFDIEKKVVPFFDNTSCLLVDVCELKKHIKEIDCEDIKIDDNSSDWIASVSWENLAKLARAWDKEKPNPFFSFPHSEPENWNCLFFEILADFGHSITPSSSLVDFLVGPEQPQAALIEASLIMNSLLGGWHSDLGYTGPLRSKDSFDMSAKEAVISRHWFTTLYQTLDAMNLESENNERFDFSRFKIRRLPGNYSVSGEWYLGVLGGSIATSMGGRILNFIASHDADCDRFRLGVGLPVTRPELFEASDPNTRSPIADCFDADFFREGFGPSCRFIDRSNFIDYRKHSPRLTKLLRSIIRIKEENNEQLKSKIELRWSRFADSLRSGE